MLNSLDLSWKGKLIKSVFVIISVVGGLLILATFWFATAECGVTSYTWFLGLLNNATEKHRAGIMKQGQLSG